MIKASGSGQWPGQDVPEADQVIFGELGDPHLPFLPELPARGVGADRVGRSAAVLTELPVDLQSYGWRLTQRPGADLQRARSFLASDLNMIADVVGVQQSVVPELKVQLLGPLSLAAALHLPLGERAISDLGARRDIADSLAAGLSDHLSAVREAAPDSRLVLQIDEPEAKRALSGAIPTVSGYRRIRSVSRQETRMLWSTLIEAAQRAGAEETLLSIPGGSLTEALESDFDGVALPATDLDAQRWEQVAPALEAGRRLWLGIDTVLDARISTRQRAESVWRTWRTLGLPASLLSQLRLIEAADFAQSTPEAVKVALGRLTDLSDALQQFAAQE
ncbi:hypothetical protein [Psychromicrobium lacuslunae]|uniref:Cobalamin-independent methionine synthase MetE C-terminal/archaeal domain-containing protein n=1 Tax=Psychromicrobium lacuslunae TaxID=1618207 RepID=A0A0D4BYN1_9MICC|nr:hypothetical protein [Psychromicrobium lacuslunae]AJT41448.1 hypothetical protein UM93_07830 [Psychromicrobium lacuslunae]